MMNRIPNVSDQHKICIICEGDEDFAYLQRLNELSVWNPQYKVSLKNAAGNGNIPAIYQDIYQNGSYEIVLIFCDTERKPYEQYNDIKSKVNKFHGNENASEQVLIFSNPCTMLIISQHWTNEIIKTAAKSINAPLIEKYTGVKNYKARQDQIGIIMEQITLDNFMDMKKRMGKLYNSDSILGSSNFGVFVERLQSDDSNWICKINNILEEQV